MKSLLLIPIVILSVGCSSLSKFDSNEYNLLNSITTAAELGKASCGTQKADQFIDGLYIRSIELKNYSKNLANNDYVASSANKLVIVTKEFVDRKNSKDGYSPKYCELKMDTIYSISTSIQSVSGYKGK